MEASTLLYQLFWTGPMGQKRNDKRKRSAHGYSFVKIEDPLILTFPMGPAFKVKLTVSLFS